MSYYNTIVIHLKLSGLIIVQKGKYTHSAYSRWFSISTEEYILAQVQPLGAFEAIHWPPLPSC